MRCWKSAIAILFLVIVVPNIQAQGIFDSTAGWPQIGNVFIPGDVTVSGEGVNAVYTLEGNGNGLGDTGAADEGFYLYTTLSGSWSLQARVRWDPEVPFLGSVGLMIRDEAEVANSRHYSTVMRVDANGEHTATRYRNLRNFPGLPTFIYESETGEPITDPGNGLWLRMTHVEELDLFFSEYSFDGTTWVLGDLQVFPWRTDELSYGLFIANDEDFPDIVQARVDNVTLQPAIPVANRSLSHAAFQAGDTVFATIDVYNSSENPISIEVQETVPQGWTATQISNGGTLNDQTITWSLPNVPPGVTAVTYRATAPESPESRAVWQGLVVDSIPIQGDSGLLFSGGDFTRVSEDLLVLYEFQEGSGDRVIDTSGFGEPLNLTISNTNNVQWSGNSLKVIGPTKIRSGDPAFKLWDVFTDFDHEGEITVETWVSPANTVQSGIARMVTYSHDTSNRNFTLGQDGDAYQFRLRSGAPGQNANGVQPYLTTVRNVVTASLTHVVYVRDSFWNTFIYLNNELFTEEQSIQDGYFENWNPDYQFGLADEINAERPWLGEFFLVAVYRDALTREEIAQNFGAGIGTQTDVQNWSLY